jgi:hypothetical protein
MQNLLNEKEKEQKEEEEDKEEKSNVREKREIQIRWMMTDTSYYVDYIRSYAHISVVTADHLSKS